ncbi:MAG TPA: hypothetical protein VLZ77_04340 [Acidimicrobiales bacterium]|nr:hypothetical protein [Acidimicrobiales bacterium]
MSPPELAAESRVAARRVPVVFGTLALLVVVAVVGTHFVRASKHVAARTIPVDVSCPTPGVCVVVDDAGNAVWYRGHAWSKATSIQPDPLNRVSCATPSFCVAVGVTGEAEAYRSGVWSPPYSVVPETAGLRAPSSGPTGLGVVSCPVPTRCVAGDALGRAIVFDGQMWQPPTVIRFPDVSHRLRALGHADIAAISCPAPTWCAAVSVSGDVALFDGTRWRDSASLQSISDIESARYKAVPSVAAVSCVSRSFCVAVDAFGRAFTYRGSWSEAEPIDPDSAQVGNGLGLSAVSCTSSTFCMAVDDRGDAMVYDGTSWSAPTQADPILGLARVSCASPTFCMALDDLGHALRYDGSGWSAPQAVER